MVSVEIAEPSGKLERGTRVLVLLGGFSTERGRLNDVWRSEDDGATWSQLWKAAGDTAQTVLEERLFPGRFAHCALVRLSNGSLTALCPSCFAHCALVREPREGRERGAVREEP